MCVDILELGPVRLKPIEHHLALPSRLKHRPIIKTQIGRLLLEDLGGPLPIAVVKHLSSSQSVLVQGHTAVDEGRRGRYIAVEVKIRDKAPHQINK